MNKKMPSLSSPMPAASPRERCYPESELIAWIYEAQEAAYLGADSFERYFMIAGEKMLCRVAFYWTDKADLSARIAKIECLPVAAQESY